MKTIKLIILMTLTTTALNAENPFFADFNTPHDVFPFDKIKTEHFKPAFEEGMKREDKEIQAIITNKQEPDFENTIVALEHSGELLGKVSSVFYNLQSAETTDTLDALSMEMSPILTEHSNNISLNEDLFKRVKAVYGKKDKLNLTVEQQTLLKKTYDGFVRSGANLSDKDKETYRKLSTELNTLTLQFGQNVLKETNQYQLVVTEQDKLSGLPADFLETAAAKAKEKGKEGWLFDLTAPSYVPFMKYADNGDLRRELWTAYNTKCIKGGEYDNRENIRKITALRLQIAQLLGYKDYAEYVLQKRMAENEQNVYHLLNELLTAYRPTALQEYADVQTFAKKNDLMSWDWSYYSEKLKDEKFNINDELLKPYFELEKVKRGVFGLATRLYGLQFRRNEKIPVYHKEVEAYEVFDENGKYLAVLYTDFHPREGKRSGAWMTDYRGQKKVDGVDFRPHISVVMNFTRPTATKPALLTYDEVNTFLHEFGHALHGMLSDVTYESLSGTNVYWDFVELPSQIMENWTSEQAFLDSFAVHYETGEKLPIEYIKRIKAADNFNVAYACLRQLSFCYLDMAWHTLKTPYTGDVLAFETEAMASTQILPRIDGTSTAAAFNHVFSGGYAAGYYSYKWAEVLDADAFSVFQKNGIFDKKTAASFRENILSKGSTEPPMTLYKRFRGQEPTIDGLLERNGIKK
ncbi:MAG: M3 family metallopeptidase [Prevotellaceae bacterium]|nr:M3 family metallopeptidase [Prevotellaceae bacterium]